MKVNYQPRNRSRYQYFRKILILLVIFIFGAFIFSFFDAIVIAVVSPVWKVDNAITRSLKNGITFFNSQKALTEENIMLKEKLSSLQIEILSLSNDKSQKDILLELLGRRQNSEMLIATVLTRPPQTPYDVIIIDVGSDNSLVIGSEVFLPEGPVIGSVSEVFSKKARVELFSSANKETNAILERNNIPVTLVGAGAGNFKLILPRNIAVESGDRILSTDISLHLMAVVGEISIRSTDSFKEVLAKSPENIFAIRFVFVKP